MPTNSPEHDAIDVERRLGDELLKIHLNSYGTGAERTEVHLFDHGVVCVLDGLELTPGEQFMIAAGHADAVIDIRRRYQKAIEPTFWAAAERATGRAVIAFTSQVSVDPPFAVEFFRLSAPVKASA